MTYGCNHTESRRRPEALAIDKDMASGLNASPGEATVDSLLREAETKEDHDEYDIIGCDAILDIYYFYESTSYQIIQLGEHEHNPTNMPQHLFGNIPGLAPLNQ